MTTAEQETPVPGRGPDPALHQRLRDPVFTRAFDSYRDVVVRRALWASTKRRSGGPAGRARGALAG